MVTNQLISGKKGEGENGTNRTIHIGKMDVERLIKMSRDNIPAGRTFSGRPKDDVAT